MKRILVVNGPNLNLLGVREPEIYGRATLKDIEEEIVKFAREKVVEIRFFQSNAEGAIIDKLHAEREWADGIIINPGAFTHYSYAIHDAIAAIAVPTLEVHITNIHRREGFRQRSVIAPACVGQIYGEGVKSYLRALRALID